MKFLHFLDMQKKKKKTLLKGKLPISGHKKIALESLMFSSTVYDQYCSNKQVFTKNSEQTCNSCYHLILFHMRMKFTAYSL